LANKFIKQLLKCLIPAFLTVSFSVAIAANTKEMDEAVKRYYAGYPDEAISMIKPLALSGDVDAQYLLGNILYSLSEKGKLSTIEDPVKWYKMAAEHNSADAVYALGVIFHNRWSKSHNKKEAANAIIYYQNAVELGSIKAQEPLSKVISRSGISLQKAEAFIKEQGTTSAPKSESRVQISKSEIGNFESDETLVPLSNSLAKNNSAIKRESDAGDKSTVENSNQTVQTADTSDDELAFTVTLADIAKHCQNYTETGFNLYAETIKGALFSGKASMETIKLDPSESGAYSVGLTHKQIDLVIFLDLRAVPKIVAVRYEKGDVYAVAGIVVASKAVGSNCTVSAIYQSSKD
jgi:hypothetical protein